MVVVGGVGPYGGRVAVQVECACAALGASERRAPRAATPPGYPGGDPSTCQGQYPLEGSLTQAQYRRNIGLNRPILGLF